MSGRTIKTTKISRNEPCPCGSGKKYKKCCIDKDFEWTTDEKGQIYKSVHLNDEAMEILERQRAKFIEKFGREPGPGDPVFFDLPPEEEVRDLAVEAMQSAGIPPELIYAYKKIGMMVTEDNYSLWSEKDLDEYEAAIDEYKKGN